jgi:RNA ligase
MKFDLEYLEYLRDEKLVNKVTKGCMSIWTYSKSAQYNKAFIEHPVLMNCRGLVFNNEGDVLAFPMAKFFNQGEIKGFSPPKGNFIVYDKLDGSLCIVFHYNGEWHYITSGSFETEQANFVRNLFNLKYNTDYLNTELSYSFEVLYPENRIVVDYGDLEDIVLLTAFSREGEEYLSELDRLNGVFRIVETYDFDDYCDLKSLNWDNKEGFVVRFSDGTRMKIKFEKYRNLHFVATEMNRKTIWESLAGIRKLDELIGIMPDEFYDIYDKLKEEFIYQYNLLYDEMTNIFAEISSKITVDVSDVIKHKKAFAELVSSHVNSHFMKSLLLYKYKNDENVIRDLIWRKLKPTIKTGEKLTSYCI